MNTREVPSNLFTVAPGVWGRKDVFVNYYMIQDLDTDDWVLVDGGLKWSVAGIKEMAGYLFGEESVPKAIILTHGHFDHTGSVQKLATEWNVPVYAHQMEVPYLTGHSDYPPPDPTVGGGLMAAAAFLYPHSAININTHLQILPNGGTVPFLTEWHYIHTPGHSPGHISLYRESDSVLIAGDAFVTTDQESILAVMMQSKIISGPPKYFTCDWQDAEKSVNELVKLQPKIAATGHGQPLRGKELQQALEKLVLNFADEEIPGEGRYIPNPAITNANGVMYIPPKKPGSNETALRAFGITALLALGLVWSSYKKKKRSVRNESLLDVEYNY